MEITGKIRVINATQQVSAAYQKRELVITTEEQYPQHIMIEFTQDKCDLLNHFRVRDYVTVSINLRGREWTNPQGETKYFNSIQGWRLEKCDRGETQPSYENENIFENENEDLPF